MWFWVQVDLESCCVPVYACFRWDRMVELLRAAKLKRRASWV